MKHTKTLIAIVLLSMIIGFATITTSLSINADMELLGNLDDFYIYYSRAVVNGVEDPSIIVSATELDFGAALETVGTPYVIEYDITNASTAFDAEISINCEGSTEYFEISNEFDETTPLGAKQTRTGTLTLTKIKTVSGDDINNTVACSVVATPVERESLVTESIIPSPLDKKYPIGQEITIGTEKFNVISTTKDSVKLLAKENINADYEQSIYSYKVIWPTAGGWEYTPGPKEVDLKTWAPNVYELVEGYAQRLQTELQDSTITSDLITVKELGMLGCDVTEDYSIVTDENYNPIKYDCAESPYFSWLTGRYIYFTKSAISNKPKRVYTLRTTGRLDIHNSTDGNVVRPTITISRETLNNILDYPIGREIYIGSEGFNVISSTASTVTMLAKYNLGADYTQTTEENAVTFSENYGWEYTPGPKEIDIQQYEGNAKTYVNEYVEYLKSKTEAKEIAGNLISLKELESLGCTINKNYSYQPGQNGGCENSIYKQWLNIDLSWWTRSSREDDESAIWFVSTNGSLDGDFKYDDYASIRPTITIPIDKIPEQ